MTLELNPKVEAGLVALARAAQLDQFNKELGRRLASLDRGERIDPVEARSRLQRKSNERRKQHA